MNLKHKLYGSLLVIAASTQTASASKTGIAELIDSFTTTDLKPILAAILFAGLLIGIIFNLGKLFQPDGWKGFVLNVGVYILVAAAIGGLIAGFRAIVGTF